MSNKTIAKFTGLVILFALTSASFSCAHGPLPRRHAVDASTLSPDFAKPVTIGHIESPEIIESSGIATSLCQPDVLWTHNDSGDDAFIFALNSKGKHLGTWRVTNARNDDWEDMALYKDPSGTCYLYIGDIGNNSLGRSELHIYRVKEPNISPEGSASSKKRPLATDPAAVLRFKYPDTPHNAETLMAQPKSGEIYVLTKRFDGPSLVYKLAPTFDAASLMQAQRVGEVTVPSIPNGLLTGGSIAPDGKHAVVCDYSAAYLFDLGGSANFDEIWKQKPVVVDLGERKQGEAVTFGTDGNSIMATSEKKNSPLIEVKRK